MSESRDNKTQPQRVFTEILNEGRLEVADEIVAPGFLLHSPTRPEPFEGPDGFKDFVTDLRRGFPDLNITIDHVIAEGDFVSIRSRVTGTHLGTYRGIPPTGRKISQSQLHMFHVVDGQINETWQEIDGLGIMQQLGIFPRGNPPRLLLQLVVGLQRIGRRR
ncbi:MAG: ester cyclase [Gaiellaceae bacterium]